MADRKRERFAKYLVFYVRIPPKKEKKTSPTRETNDHTTIAVDCALLHEINPRKCSRAHTEKCGKISPVAKSLESAVEIQLSIFPSHSSARGRCPSGVLSEELSTVSSHELSERELRAKGSAALVHDLHALLALRLTQFLHHVPWSYAEDGGTQRTTLDEGHEDPPSTCPSRRRCSPASSWLRNAQVRNRTSTVDMRAAVIVNLIGTYR